MAIDVNCGGHSQDDKPPEQRIGFLQEIAVIQTCIWPELNGYLPIYFLFILQCSGRVNPYGFPCFSADSGHQNHHQANHR